MPADLTDATTLLDSQVPYRIAMALHEPRGLAMFFWVSLVRRWSSGSSLDEATSSVPHHKRYPALISFQNSYDWRDIRTGCQGLAS